MRIIKVTQNDFDDWSDLALKLWFDCSVDDLKNILQSPRQEGFLVRDDGGRAIAFMNLSLRYDYVPGATQSPVGYVEGIFVLDEYRQQGIGRYLIHYAQQWTLEHGCVELASDALLENTASYEFHTHVGFEFVERIVTFIKQIDCSDEGDR